MSISLFSTQAGFNNNVEIDSISAFIQQKDQKSEITQNMTPLEISEIVSDKVMAVIKEQFDRVKQEFEAKSK